MKAHYGSVLQKNKKPNKKRHKQGQQEMPISLNYAKPAEGKQGFKSLLANERASIPFDAETGKAEYKSKEAGVGELTLTHSLPPQGHFRLDVEKSQPYEDLNQYLNDVQKWLDQNTKSTYRIDDKNEGAPKTIGGTPNRDKAAVLVYFQDKADADKFEEHLTGTPQSLFEKAYTDDKDFESNSNNFLSNLFKAKADTTAEVPIPTPDLLEKFGKPVPEEDNVVKLTPVASKPTLPEQAL